MNWHVIRLHAIEKHADQLYRVRWSFAKAWPGNPLHGWHEREVRRLWVLIEDAAEDMALVDAALGAIKENA